MKLRNSVTLHAGLSAALLTGWASLLVAATPSEQHAIVQTGNGGPEVLNYQTVPVLQPGENQVLIRIYAAAVNPVDWKMRLGMRRPAPAGGAAGPAGGAAAGPPPGGGAPAQSIPGLDVAGVIEQVGAGVTKLKVGEKVFSMIGRGPVNGLNGAYSQFVIAPAANVVAKPANFTFEQAAGIGTVGMTGERTIQQTKLSKGQRVLITGVAGGVGSSTAQIALALGAHVIGTASARHADFLKSIGVTEVIDYTDGKWEDKIKDIDVVIDTVGGDTPDRALTTLKKGGTLASVAGSASPDKCSALGVTCLGGGPPGPGGPSEGDMLSAVAKLAAAGKFKVHVDLTYPLEQAAEAQEYNRAGHSEGKDILIVDAAKANTK
jgi:NADPH:quinone reductase-like Zn-dependent oxidoreductase